MNRYQGLYEGYSKVVKKYKMVTQRVYKYLTKEKVCIPSISISDMTHARNTDERLLLPDICVFISQKDTLLILVLYMVLKVNPNTLYNLDKL